MRSFRELFGHSFDDLEAARGAIDEIGIDIGHCLVIRHYKPNKAMALRIVLVCCQGGKFKSKANAVAHGSRRRKANSGKRGCPFKISIVRVDLESPFVIIGHPSDDAKRHNHPKLDAAAFPRYRTMTIRKHRDDIISCHRSGQAPAKIIEYLRSQKQLGVDITTRDVSNCIANYTREQLKDHDPMTVLYNKMQHNNAYNFKVLLY